MAKSRVVIAADSVSEAGDRVTTMAIQVPWSHLDEFRNLLVDRQHMTSCLTPLAGELRRQAAEDPFVPSSIVSQKAIAIWLGTRNIALSRARELDVCDVPERDYRNLLTPFLRRTVVITAGEWWNFSTPIVSEISPDVQAVMDEVLTALDHSEPRLVHNTEDHLPFIQDEERDGVFELSEKARKVAAVRCSRGSHLYLDGECHVNMDIQLFELAPSMRHFDETPFGVFDFMRHVVSPFTEEEEVRKIAHAEAFIEANKPEDATYTLLMEATEKALAPRFKPGRYPGWF